MSKPGKVLKALCKKLGVRLTVKRGKKRVYKSIKVLKKQCSKKKLSRGSKYGRKKKVNYRKKRILSELRELDKDYGLSSKNMSSSLVGFPNWYFLGMKGGNYSERGRMNYFITRSAKKGVTMTKPDAKTYVKIMDKIVEKETLSPEDKNFVVQFKLITKSQMNKAAWCLKNPGSCTSVKFVLELAALLGSSAAVMASIMGGVRLYLHLINYLAYGARKRDRESIIQNTQEGLFGKRKRKVKKKN